MYITVIIRDKDDMIWCPIARDWVDKYTESAHFSKVIYAMDAMEDMPREDKPRMRIMSLEIAANKYMNV